MGSLDSLVIPQPHNNARPLVPVLKNALTNTVVDIKTVEGSLYGITAYNRHSSVNFVQIFDALAANVTLGTTVPKYSFAVPASSSISIISPFPLLNCTGNTGISAAFTATDTGNGAPTATACANFFVI